MAGLGKKHAPLTEETSCRLSLEQKRRLQLAAQRAGIRPSELMRAAVVSQCDGILGKARDVQAELAGIIGAVCAPGDVARRTGEAFAEIANEKQSRKRRALQ